jgi:serine/threonine protein kinase
MACSSEVHLRAEGRLGTVLNGKWHLDEVLGVGGMATVYAATHRNQKRVAVKMLHPELSLEENVRVRFLREGYVANTVGHPGAVTIFDDNIAEDGAAFLVMELLEGETAHARLARDGVFQVDQALALGDDVLDVLIAAHEKGIVHRDLKPENLFLTHAGKIKLLDFGIARLRELPMGTGASANAFFMGTPAFMSPEHARGKWDEVDAQSDIWSVGATLYTLLAGKFVHESETAVDTLVLAVTQAPRPLRAVAERIPERVAAVIDRALAFHKQDRWVSARDMQVALRSVRLGLAPEQLVLRGGQRSESPSDRSPSSPRGEVHATVRSSGPPISSPGEGAQPSPSPGTDSLEPLDTTRAGTDPARQRDAANRRAWLKVVVAALSLAAVGAALYGRDFFQRKTSTVAPGQVLVPSTDVAPASMAGNGKEGPPGAGTAARSGPAPANAASLAEVPSAPVVPPASATSAARTNRPEKRSVGAPFKAPASASVLAPAPPPAEVSGSEGGRENPFDRRF